MQWKDLKVEIANLPWEEKIIGAASFSLFLSCFFPWYYGREYVVSAGGYEYINSSGFQSVAFIIGYFICAFALINLVIIGMRVAKKRLFKLPIAREKIFILLGAESFLLQIIALAIYTKQTFLFSQAEVRFGLYIGLFSSLVISSFGYAYKQSIKDAIAKKKAEQLFVHTHKQNVNLKPELHTETKPQDGARNIYHQAVSNISQNIEDYQTQQAEGPSLAPSIETAERNIHINPYQETEVSLSSPNEQLSIDDIAPVQK